MIELDAFWLGVQMHERWPELQWGRTRMQLVPRGYRCVREVSKRTIESMISTPTDASEPPRIETHDHQMVAFTCGTQIVYAAYSKQNDILYIEVNDASL